MTRKDFQVIATMLGDMGREQTDEQFHQTLDVAVRHLKGTNAQFKQDVFRNWSADVRDHRRSIDGVKIA
jgi:hypothetical protein